eukprot:TRINITY_DN36234_c0_g1_i4.p1 TRINITY_DN36234_c0_g1~~TRINITY_DN36234_c0_g1_i4.p1  ORF type:complete len:392 (-),score=25.88 TRINITY_DN36234_c0_g1_i4:62-1237(-)
MDSLGNSLRLEAFYIHIAIAGTKTRYLIGLRENSQISDRFERLPTFGADSQVNRAPVIQEAISSDSSTHSSLSSAGSRPMMQAVPDRQLTAPEVKLLMIETLLKRCSFRSEVRHSFGSCCGRHQAVKDLVKLVLAWKTEACDVSFSYHSGWQCGACGVLHQGDPTHRSCQVCMQHAGRIESEPPVLTQLTGAAVLGPSLESGSVSEHAAAAAVLGDAACVKPSVSGSLCIGPAMAATDAFQANATDPSRPRSSSRPITDNSNRGLPQFAAEGHAATPTCPRAARGLVDEVLRSWNFALTKDFRAHSCCSKHCALEHLLRRLVEMQRQPCDTRFSQYSTWQCWSCGVLDYAVPPDGSCGVCRHPNVAEQPDSANADSSFIASRVTIASTVDF